VRVALRPDDVDRHGAGCPCGLRDANGKSYGAALFADGEAQERVYGPSEAAALRNARAVAWERRWRVVPAEEAP
jgi:hypothetical protein